MQNEREASEQAQKEKYTYKICRKVKNFRASVLAIQKRLLAKIQPVSSMDEQQRKRNWT